MRTLKGRHVKLVIIHSFYSYFDRNGLQERILGKKMLTSHDHDFATWPSTMNRWRQK